MASLGYLSAPRNPRPPEMKYVRDRVFPVAKQNRMAFLETANLENAAQAIDEGVRIIAGGRRLPGSAARARRTMPV